MTFAAQTIAFGLLLFIAVPCVHLNAQRPPYAGQRPITDIGVVPLDNRFGGGGSSGSTAALPVAALGDASLVNQLNQRPANNRPFWLTNFEAIEAQKNGGRRPPAPVAGGSPLSASSAAALPELTNRFAADDAVQKQQPLPQQPQPQPPKSPVLVHGSANDAGNNLISRPQIVYPLPAQSLTPVPSSGAPTVIMLNGQPFLLTPLVGDAGSLTGDAITQLHLQQQQQLNMQHQGEQSALFFD